MKQLTIFRVDNNFVVFTIIVMFKYFLTGFVVEEYFHQYLPVCRDH